MRVRPVTFWPDRSVRRAMLRIPVTMAPDSVLEGEYPAQAHDDPMRSAFERLGPLQGRFRAKPHDLIVEEETIRLLDPRTGRRLAEITCHGPDLTGDNSPAWTVIEQGPFFLWLRWMQTGEQTAREVDIRASATGRIRITHRLQSGLKENAWTPDFGITVRMPGGTIDKPGPVTAHFSTFDRIADYEDAAELVPSFTLMDGTAISLALSLVLRQHRGTLSLNTTPGRMGGNPGATVVLSRLEPVSTEAQGLMIQDGQWRVTELLLSPENAGRLTARLDRPLRGGGHWQAYGHGLPHGTAPRRQTPGIEADDGNRRARPVAPVHRRGRLGEHDIL